MTGGSTGAWTCIECHTSKEQGTWSCKGSTMDVLGTWRGCTMTWRKHQQRQADDRTRERDRASF
eukprot:8674131-Pyramimonas_sp.AAC.1